MYIATNLNSFYFLKKKKSIYNLVQWNNTCPSPPNNIIDTFKMSKKKKEDLKSKTKLTSSKKLAQQRKLSLAKLKKN